MQVIEVNGVDYEFPDSMSDADISSALNKEFGAIPMPRQTTAKAPSGFARGMRDPLDAAAQMLSHAVPDSWERNINQFNNWLVDKGVPLARIPDGGLDEQLRQQEASYQEQRKASGETGMDWDRLGGNVASPVNLLLASRVPQVAMKAAPMLTSSGVGALFGLLQPVYDGDFATEKSKQAGIGMVAGPVTQKAIGGISSLVRPNTSKDVLAVMREGVRPTPGQIMGGMANKMEEKAMSLPIVGDAIAASRQRGIAELNVAAFNRALNPIGKVFPKGVDIGRKGVEYVKKQLGDAYDSLLPKLQGVADNQFNAELSTIRQMANSLPKARAKQINRIIDEDVLRRFTQHGKASGETVKAIESKLNSLAKNYSASADGDQRLMADAIRETQAVVRRMVERVNPQYGKELQAINKGYANYAIIRDAASRRGAKEGVMSPANLASASRVADKSVGKGRTATGNALMQDLTDAAENVLATKFPNSGTADRLLANSAALGAAYVEPNLLMGAGLSSLPYLPGARNVIAGLLASRPQVAEPVANAIRRTTPFLIPAGSEFAYGLLGPNK